MRAKSERSQASLPVPDVVVSASRWLEGRISREQFDSDWRAWIAKYDWEGALARAAEDKRRDEISKGEEALRVANGESSTSPIVQECFSGSLTEFGRDGAETKWPTRS